jgi:hypothetical protein
MLNPVRARRRQRNLQRLEIDAKLGPRARFQPHEKLCHDLTFELHWEDAFFRQLL